MAQQQAGARDHQPGPDIVVPSWVLRDWQLAVLLAVVALGGWFVLGVLLFLASLAVTWLEAGSSGVAWGDLLASLVALPLAYLGGLEGVPVLLTGLAVAYAAFLVAVRGVKPAGAAFARPVRLAALAAKAGLVFTLVLLVIAIVFDVFGVGLAARPEFALFSGEASAGGYNYVAVVFLLLPVCVAAAAAALLRGAGHGVAWLLGVPEVDVPSAVSSSWVGVRRASAVAVGVLVVWALGFSLELATDGFERFSELAAGLLSTVVLGALAAAVDITALGFVGAMSFLADGGLVFSAPAPSWAWASVAVVAAAWLAAGHRAAQHRGAETLAQALWSASLIGPLMAGIGVVVALVWSGQFVGDSLATKAILLPLPWGVVSLGGAWLYAVRHQLPSGIAVSPDEEAVVPEELPSEEGGAR